jgi:hypothetical protein
MPVDPSILIGLATAILTAITTVIGLLVRGYISRLKLAQNEYAEIIKSNTAFRDEIKKDLNGAKKELKFALEEIKDLKNELDKSRGIIFKLECQIKVKDEEILELNRHIYNLQNKP